MLGGKELLKRIGLAATNPKHLSIIPKPDLKQMGEKGEASVELRLGRWFMSLRQARISRVELSGLSPDVQIDIALSEAGVVAGSRAIRDDNRLGKGKAEPWNKSNLAAGKSEHARVALDKNHFVPFGDQFILHPGRFVIGATLEWIRLPLDAGGYVTGKSSLGRHGLVIETAAAIHPRFTGCLALEIANVGEVPLVLRPGMPIAQLLLHKISGAAQPAISTLSGRRKPYLPTLKPDERLKALAS